DPELALRGHDLHVVRVDPRELDDHRQLVRVVRVIAVDLRSQHSARAGEARNLPELFAEFADLALQPVDVLLGHVPKVTAQEQSARPASLKTRPPGTDTNRHSYEPS